MRQRPRSSVIFSESMRVEYATLEWVDWFNHRRLLEPIGNVPPVEYEMMYYRQLEESTMAD